MLTSYEPLSVLKESKKKRRTEKNELMNGVLTAPDAFPLHNGSRITQIDPKRVPSNFSCIVMRFRHGAVIRSFSSPCTSDASLPYVLPPEPVLEALTAIHVSTIIEEGARKVVSVVSKFYI